MLTAQPDYPYLGDDEMDDPTDHLPSCCPACGDVIDYCPGHGEIGDPEGARILNQHDDENHSDCNPNGCEDADPHQFCTAKWCEAAHEPNSRCPKFHT